MVAISFPNSPENGDTHTINAVSYIYDGSSWKANGISDVHSLNSFSGSTNIKTLGSIVDLTANRLIVDDDGYIGSTNSTTAIQIANNGDVTFRRPPVGLSFDTISSGSIADARISSAATWNAKIDDIVSDTSPQLGGNLDINSHDIVTTSNADIDLDPNGSGVVVFKGNATKGSGQFKLNCEQNTHGITIKGPPHSAAASYTLVLPNNDGDADQVLTTDGGGNLSWQDSSGGGTITALNNATANELVTVGSTTTELDAETNLTYDAATTTMTMISTDAGSAANPTLMLYRNSSSPTANDEWGQIHFQGKDSGGNVRQGAIITMDTSDYRDYSLDTRLVFKIIASHQGAGANAVVKYQMGQDVIGSNPPSFRIPDNTWIGSESDPDALKISNTGAVTFNSAFTFPTTDGSNGQQLSTDGNGVVTWAAAGTGGGGGSGDITTDTAWATKGDLIVATGNDAASILAAGTDDYVLTADASENTGLKWAAAGGGGGSAFADAQVKEYTEYSVALGSGPSSNAPLGNMTAGTNRFNIAIGYDCLTDLTTAVHQTAIGHECLSNVTTSSSSKWNVAIGEEALQSLTGTSHRNVAIGDRPGKNGTTGHTNVWIGASAGAYTASGGYNVCAGYYAGKRISSGSNNICLGKKSGETGSPSGRITTASNVICLGNNSIGNLYCNDTTISSSDERDKTDIEDFSPGLSFVKKLRPVTYRWDKRDWYLEDDEEDSILDAVPDGTMKSPRQHAGFIAQEVLVIEKEFGFGADKNNMLFVNLNEDDTAYGLKYERLVPVLVNAIKELSIEVDKLKAG